MTTKKQIENLLKKRILVKDGSTGTFLRGQNLKSSDYGGKKFFGLTESLVLNRPEIAESVPNAYFKAGADIAETCTFNANFLSLREYGLEEKTIEINKKAAQIVKSLAQKYSTVSKPRFVGGSIGPTNKSLSLDNNISYDEMYQSYKKQVLGLVKGGIDILMTETHFDTLNLKASLDAIFSIVPEDFPVFATVSIEKNGTMLSGQTIEAVYASVKHYPITCFGINCALGPNQLLKQIARLSKISKHFTIIYPNAGIPDSNGIFPLDANKFSNEMSKILERKYANIVGGCCGTTPKHIELLSSKTKNFAPRKIPKIDYDLISGLTAIDCKRAKKPILISEKTNMVGSKEFRDLILSKKFEESAEILNNQIKNGAQITDLCFINKEIDEIEIFKKFFENASKKIKIPISIDSMNYELFEIALKKIQGKSIVNSINFEKGKKNAEKIAKLAKKYGAKVVFGAIDSKGIKKTAKEKFRVLSDGIIFLRKLHFEDSDIIVDPLVLPISAENRSIDTLLTIKMIKKAFPAVSTIIGLSNLSFGLPKEIRDIFNYAFLKLASENGLDYAICDSEKVKSCEKLDKKIILTAKKIILDKNLTNLKQFIEKNSNIKETESNNKSSLTTKSIERILEDHIVYAQKSNLILDIDKALRKMTAEEIINGPLTNGMSRLGKMFDSSKVLITDVLSSAETMKSAINYLKKFIKSSSKKSKKKVLIATVKGDVHDIGKNLLKVILSNNGYEIIDLGTKVSEQKIVAGVIKHKPLAICLSGLLVQSALNMIETAKLLSKSRISIPLLVGGAALSKNFAKKIQKEYCGSVYYGKDVMEGLQILNNVTKV